MRSQQRLFTSTHGRINRKTYWFGIIALFVPGLFAAFISAIQDDIFAFIMFTMIGCIIVGFWITPGYKTSAQSEPHQLVDARVFKRQLPRYYYSQHRPRYKR